MTDIVERLRICAAYDPDQKEAADTIEALRAENAKLREERHELKNELAKWLHYWRDKDLKAVEEKNVKLLEALKQIHDAVDFPEDTLRRKIRAARAAMGESK